MSESTSQLCTLLYWVLFGVITLRIFSVAFHAKQLQSVAAFVFLIGFSARVIAISCNETLGFFAAKLAGEESLHIYHQAVSSQFQLRVLLSDTFGAQVLWNLCPWALFGPDRISLLYSNAAAGALIGPITAVGLYRCLGKKAAFWTLAIFSVHLAGFNFSIFGLRDPLLSLAFSLVATMTARLFLLGIGRMDVAVLTFAAAMVMWLRIEQCYILVFLFLIPFLQFYVKSLLGSLQSRRWMRLMLSLTGPLLVIGVIGVLGATRIVAKNVGSDTANPMELAENNAEARFARAAGDVNGGGSHMVSVEAYNNMPLYKRVPLQMVGLIVLPFPWQINGPTRLFAFLDSLMLIALMVLIVFTIVRRSWDDDSKKWFAAAMLSTYLVGLLGMGLLVSNAGNGFRLRISVTPFLMLAAVAAIPELLKRPPSIASSYPHSYSRNENRQPAQKACADLELV